MLTNLPFFCCLQTLLGILHVSQGSFVSMQLYPSCVGTGFRNFSYAQASQGTQGNGSTSCLNINNRAPPMTVTWFYYVTYPPTTCDNPSLPDGQQCCHATATSTITFYKTEFVNGAVTTVGTSTGNVTAGAFLGRSATWIITKNLANLNLNCGTAYGQEASVGIAELRIANGPVCLNGAELAYHCPGP